MNMSNIKDTLSTICAWVTVVGGAVLAAVVSGALVLSPTITGILTTIVGVAIAISQFLTGKLPNGTTKTPDQINAANNGK